MEHEIQTIDYTEIEKRARIARAEAMHAGLRAIGKAIKSLFAGRGFAGQKTA
ncbi:MAG: hypothetical protein AAF340_08685 [Pseudomonadota bacterium]